MKTLLLTLTFALISTGIVAQNFVVPENYQLEQAEDYAPYEQDIINVIDWLMKTPLDEQQTLREEAAQFLLQWLMGSPYVHIYLTPQIVTFLDTSPGLLLIFMGGWAKYSIESEDYDNRMVGAKSGIEAVIEFYTKNGDLMPADSNIEKYIKMKEQGTLGEFIEKNM